MTTNTEALLRGTSRENDAHDEAKANRYCDMGVDCGEYGACYAAANGEPERCSRATHPAPTQPEQANGGEPVAWAPVPEFEDLYEVSSLGEIRSMVTGKVLAKNKMGAGYIKADLWKDGSRKQTSVHRVVASAFLGDLTGLEVNHINGDKTDNRVSNLELATRSENERHSRSKLKNLVKPVLARNLTTGNILEFESVEAAARFGFVPSSIYRCCYGICKKHRGYEFAFKNPSHADGKKAITHPAPAASVSDEREAFEAEMRCEEVWGHRSLVKRPDGRYQNWQVNAMWDVWQARAALRPAQAGDQWREAVEDWFVIDNTDMPEDPREAIKKLIATEVRDALDPTISSAAAALVQAGVPDDIVKDAKRYRWLRRKACVIGKTTYCGEETGQPILDFVNLPDVTEVISRDSATTLDAAIDAAIDAAAPKEGGNAPD